MDIDHQSVCLFGQEVVKCGDSLIPMIRSSYGKSQVLKYKGVDYFHEKRSLVEKDPLLAQCSCLMTVLKERRSMEGKKMQGTKVIRETDIGE